MLCFAMFPFLLSLIEKDETFTHSFSHIVQSLQQSIIQPNLLTH
jgi:hypothetical protein